MRKRRVVPVHRCPPVLVYGPQEPAEVRRPIGFLAKIDMGVPVKRCDDPPAPLVGFSVASIEADDE